MPLTFEQFKALRAKGLTPEQIASFEQGNAPKPPEQPTFGAALHEATRRNLNLAPIIGGAIGGIGGPPGIAAGAGIGENIRQMGLTALGENAPAPGPEGLKAIQQQMLLQPALDTGGQVAVAGAKGVGKLAMRTALGRSTKDVAQMAIDKAILATKGGLAKTLNYLGLAGDKARLAAAQATDQGMRISRDELASQTYKDVLPAVTEGPIKEPSARLLDKLNTQFVSDNAEQLTPYELHVMKQRADRLADPIYRRQARGEPVSNLALSRASWYKSLADNIRTKLNSIEGYQAANAEAQTLMGVKTGVKAAAKQPIGKFLASRSAPFSGGAIAGVLAPAPTYKERVEHSVIGGTGAAFLSTPSVLSLIALMASNPTLLKLLAQTPRAGAALYQESK